MRGWFTAAMALVAGVAGAQDAPVASPATTIVDARDLRPSPPVALAALPDGSGAWVLQFTTSGGVMGTGARTANFAVTSEGRMACEVGDCARSLPLAELRGLADRLSKLDAGLWPGLPSVADQITLCRDCLRTTLTLLRREGDVVAVYAASWDPSQPVAAPIRELASEMRALAGRR